MLSARLRSVMSRTVLSYPSTSPERPCTARAFSEIQIRSPLRWTSSDSKLVRRPASSIWRRKSVPARRIHIRHEAALVGLRHHPGLVLISEQSHEGRICAQDPAVRIRAKDSLCSILEQIAIAAFGRTKGILRGHEVGDIHHRSDQEEDPPVPAADRDHALADPDRMPVQPPHLCDEVRAVGALEGREHSRPAVRVDIELSADIAHLLDHASNRRPAEHLGQLGIGAQEPA